MKRTLLAATCLVAVSSPSWAQQATAVGVGTGIASSKADSKAVAISGQGGTGVGNITINPSQTVAPGTVTTTRVENTGTSTVKNVPSVFAPGLAAAGLETCLGSVSAGGSFVGTGLTFGTTTPDAGCAARLDARTLWSMGLRKAAVARLCLNPDIRAAMPDVCGTYLPQPVAAIPTYYGAPAPAAYVGGEIWLVEGKTGKDRLCRDYDAPKQRCRKWDGVVTRHVASNTKQAVPLPQPKPVVVSEGK